MQLLIDIVAKGGNLAINVGPQPDGRLPRGAVKSLLGMGEWLEANGEAIYGTRVCAPYKKDNIAFTRKGSCIFALEMFEEEESEVPESVLIPLVKEPGKKPGKVSLLETGRELEYEIVSEGILVRTPVWTGKAPISRVYKIEEEQE